MLLEIPNLPHLKVAYREGRPVPIRWCVRGERNQNSDDALDHVTIGRNLKLFDLERAAKLSGSGFICFTGVGARLERKLDSVHARSAHTRAWLRRNEARPFLVWRECMIRNNAAAKI